MMKLIKILDTIEENRKTTNQKYPVKEIAFLVLSGLVCGYSSWRAITEFGEYNLKWLRKFMPYKQGIPTRHNVARIIRMIKPESLNHLLLAWANAYSKKSNVEHSDEEIKRIRSVFAIDGKEIKGVKARTGEVLNSVTVFDIDNGISFSTEMGAGKGQEIRMVQNVLKTLNLKECIVTLDALHCQTETVKEIVKGKGIALIQVKGNQPKLHEAIDHEFQALWRSDKSESNVSITEDRGHGRIEQRSAYVIDAKLNKELKQKWPHIKTFIAIVRDRSLIRKKRGSYETSYYLCTEKLTASEAIQYTRGHWRIENSLHWRLDVVMKEDSSEVHERTSAKNLSIFRRFALNLLSTAEYQREKKEASVPSKMRRCANDLSFRDKIILTMKLI